MGWNLLKRFLDRKRPTAPDAASLKQPEASPAPKPAQEPDLTHEAEMERWAEERDRQRRARQAEAKNKPSVRPPDVPAPADDWYKQVEERARQRLEHKRNSQRASRGHGGPDVDMSWNTQAATLNVISASGGYDSGGGGCTSGGGGSSGGGGDGGCSSGGF